MNVAIAITADVSHLLAACRLVIVALWDLEFGQAYDHATARTVTARTRR